VIAAAPRRREEFGNLLPERIIELGRDGRQQGACYALQARGLLTIPTAGVAAPSGGLMLPTEGRPPPVEPTLVR
jgi:hypothetical protein